MLVENLAKRTTKKFKEMNGGDCFELENYIFMKLWGSSDKDVVRLADGFAWNFPNNMKDVELEVLTVRASITTGT
jgi:hypothetical protein